MMMKTFGLQDKNIVLTGADGFLGSHIRTSLALEGVNVLSTDVRASIVSDELNISNEASIDKYISERLNGRKIDGLINNAALSFKGLDISEDKFEITMKTNIQGTANMIKKLKPFMNPGASIVNISSVFGSRVPEFSNYEGNTELFSNVSYGATKAGIEQITRYYAKLYGSDVRVNSVAPGGIFSDHSEDFINKYSRNVAMKRMANAGEVCNVILFLLSPLSSYITGQTISVCGGFNL